MLREREALDEWYRFVRSEAHFLRNHPHLLFQQAANRPTPSVPAVDAERRRRAGLETRPWIRRVNKPRLQLPLAATLPTGLSSVRACCFSPTGDRVAAACDGGLEVWESDTGIELASLRKGDGPLGSCRFGPDGTRIASVNVHGTIRLWTAVEEYLEVAAIGGPTDIWPGLRPFDFSPDGEHLVSSSDEDPSAARTWSARDGRAVSTLGRHREMLLACAFCPTGEQFATVSADGELKVWSMDAGREALAWQGHEPSGRGVCIYSPDGRQIASAAGSVIRLWDSRSGDALAHCEGHLDIVHTLRFSSSGRTLVSAAGAPNRLSHRDLAVRVWDTRSGEQAAELAGHTAMVTSFDLAPDDRVVVSSSRDETVRLWDLETRRELATLRGHADWVNDCAFSPDGTTIASASGQYHYTGQVRGDDSVRLWSTALAQRADQRAEEHDTAGWVHACVFSPDGESWAVAAADDTVEIRESARGQRIVSLVGHQGPVVYCAFSPGGRRLATISESDDSLRVWDLSTGEPLFVEEDEIRWNGACEFSPDGHRLAYNLWDTVVVRDGESGRRMATLDGHTGMITAWTFSPDGSHIATASEDCSVAIWDVATGRRYASLTGETEFRVTSCAFSPDGHLLVYDPGMAMVVDARTGDFVRRYLGRGSDRRSFFAPDGRNLVTTLRGPRGGLVQYWPLEGREVLGVRHRADEATHLQHDGGVLAVAMTGSGLELLTCSHDDHVRLWDLTSGREICRHRLPHGPLVAGFSSDGRRLAVATRDGGFSLLHIENLPGRPLRVTAWSRPRRFRRQAAVVAFGCPSCRAWSEVERSRLGQSLPCPECGQTVLLNETTVEADHRPVEAAWRSRPG